MPDTPLAESSHVVSVSTSEITFEKVYEASSVPPAEKRFSAFTWSEWYMLLPRYPPGSGSDVYCGKGISRRPCCTRGCENGPLPINPYSGLSTCVVSAAPIERNCGGSASNWKPPCGRCTPW